MPWEPLGGLWKAGSSGDSGSVAGTTPMSSTAYNSGAFPPLHSQLSHLKCCKIGWCPICCHMKHQKSIRLDAWKDKENIEARIQDPVIDAEEHWDKWNKPCLHGCAHPHPTHPHTHSYSERETVLCFGGKMLWILVSFLDMKKRAFKRWDKTVGAEFGFWAWCQLYI